MSAFTRGFEERCRQRGIDPNRLVKAAAGATIGAAVGDAVSKATSPSTATAVPFEIGTAPWSLGHAAMAALLGAGAAGGGRYAYNMWRGEKDEDPLDGVAGAAGLGALGGGVGSLATQTLRPTHKMNAWFNDPEQAYKFVQDYRANR